MTESNMPSRDQIKYAVQSVNAEHGWPMSFDLQDYLVDGIVALITAAADSAPQEPSALDTKLDVLGLRDSDAPARPDLLPFPHAKADKMLAPQEDR